MTSEQPDSPRFARLTRTELRPEAFSEALRRFAMASAPMTLEESGCRGIISLANADSRNVIIISLWDDRAQHTRATGSDAAMEDVESFSRDWVGPLIRETYAVFILDIPHHRRPQTGWHARVTSIEVKREYWTPLIQAGWLATEQLAQQQSGYGGAIGLGDPGSGRALFIEVWETRAALRASETTAYRQERTARTVRMLVGVPKHEIFQVHAFQPR